MSPNVPRNTERPPTVPVVSWIRPRLGSLRAGLLVLFTFLLPGLALVGPNEVSQWMFPPAADENVSLTDGTAPSSTALTGNYGEDAGFAPSTTAPSTTAPSNTVPRLSSQEVGPPRTGESPAVAKDVADGEMHPSDIHSSDEAQAAVQLALHAEPSAKDPTAEYRFRESADGTHDRMRQIQQRLQLLGARYMVLETWGDVAPRYRFYCRMTLGNGDEREYESTREDPLEAMQWVLGEVEQRMARR